MSTWGCPNDLEGICQLVRGAKCDPGMRGCVLQGKVRFASEAQNQARKPSKPPPAPPVAARKKPNIN